MSPTPPRVTLDYPLPANRADARALLDAACLALWGGTEWAPRRRRPRRELPASWRATIASGMHDKRGDR